MVLRDAHYALSFYNRVTHNTRAFYAFAFRRGSTERTRIRRPRRVKKHCEIGVYRKTINWPHALLSGESKIEKSPGVRKDGPNGYRFSLLVIFKIIIDNNSESTKTTAARSQKFGRDYNWLMLYVELNGRFRKPKYHTILMFASRSSSVKFLVDTGDV